MVADSQQLFEKYSKDSKGLQSFRRVKKKLLTFADLIEIEIENWTTMEIFAAWRYLENNTKQTLTPNGLKNQLAEMRRVFESMGLRQFVYNAKEIRVLRKGYINDKIDESDKPWSKKNANRPPYTVWRQVAGHMWQKLIDDDFPSKPKRLRMFQALLMLTWARCCGARLRELVRLKYSDVKPMSMSKGQLPYLNLNIRRSKSNQLAKKQLNYKCVQNPIDEILCPIHILQSYLRENSWINKDGDFIFALDEQNKKQRIGPRSSTDIWNTISEELDLPAHHYPQAHSGHDCFIILAMAQKRPKEEILDATQWNSLEVLPHYVQGPAVNGINHSLATTEVEDLDEMMKDLVEYNIQLKE